MDFWKWYEKNKLRLFWYKYRIAVGLDPEGNSTWFQEKQHFRKMTRLRKRALNADNAHEAITKAPFYDKQYFLAKWWDELDQYDKEKYLLHTWRNKMDGNFYGFEWWPPYFKELGFVTNCNAAKPDEPIILYRGCEPPFRDAISWFADSWNLMGEKYVYGMVTYPEQILAIVKGDALDLNGDPYKSALEYVLDYDKVNINAIYGVEAPAWQDVLA